MVDARAIKESVAFARGELTRTIATETSSFRARLFREELGRLNAFARACAERPSRFSREGLAASLEVVALYTLECIECWPDGGGIVLLDAGESMRRLSRVMAAARALKRGS